MQEMQEAPHFPCRLIRDHPFVAQSLLNRSIHEVSAHPTNPYHCLVFEKCPTQNAGHTIVFLPGALGGAEDTSHISLALLERPEAARVITFNSSISRHAFVVGRFGEDLSSRVAQMVDVLRKIKSDTPLQLIGHSLGAYEAIALTEKLINQGFNIGNLVLVAPRIGNGKKTTNCST